MREFNGCGLMISSVCQPANDHVYNCHVDVLAWRNINTRVTCSVHAGMRVEILVNTKNFFKLKQFFS